MPKPTQLSLDLSAKTVKGAGNQVIRTRAQESQVRNLDDKRRQKSQRSDSEHIKAILKLASHFK